MRSALATKSVKSSSSSSMKDNQSGTIRPPGPEHSRGPRPLKDLDPPYRRALCGERMATLRDLRKRLKAVKNIEKITKAMKMVSASRLKRAQDAIVRARP